MMGYVVRWVIKNTGIRSIDRNNFLTKTESEWIKGKQLTEGIVTKTRYFCSYYQCLRDFPTNTRVVSSIEMPNKLAVEFYLRFDK